MVHNPARGHAVQRSWVLPNRQPYRSESMCCWGRKGVAVVALGLASLAPMSAAIGEEDDAHVVRVGERSVRFRATTWRSMQNEDSTVAENFEAVRLKRGHAYPQVITVFKLPM